MIRMRPALTAGLALMLLAAESSPGRGQTPATTGEVICGNPQLVAPGAVSTDRSEVRLALAPDGTRMLWGAIGREGGAGGLDIWERRRADDGGWREPEPVTFNSPQNDFDPAFAPDGSGVYFFSNRPGGHGGDDLYFAPFDRATGMYGAVGNLGAEINTPGNEWAPGVSPDGALLLFSSDGRGGRGMQDLFLARREGSGWGGVESLGAANGPADDFDGTFLPGGDAIVFAVGDAQAERADLHVTERGDGGFGAPRRLGAQVNAPATLNFGPSISPAEPGVLFFSSHRADLTQGRLDIYRAALCRPPAGREFAATLAAHIAAIESRDLDALVSTITSEDRLTLVFPDASATHTRREYVDFHRAWFADEGWTMKFEPVSNLVRGDLGIALVRTAYTDAAGTRENLLALTFHREHEGWRLVFDQNTRIPAE